MLGCAVVVIRWCALVLKESDMPGFSPGFFLCFFCLPSVLPSLFGAESGGVCFVPMHVGNVLFFCALCYCVRVFCVYFRCSFTTKFFLFFFWFFLFLVLSVGVAVPAFADSGLMPPKGAAAIVINTNRCPDGAYIGVGRHVVEPGYALKTTSDAMRIVSTV